MVQIYGWGMGNRRLMASVLAVGLGAGLFAAALGGNPAQARTVKIRFAGRYTKATTTKAWELLQLAIKDYEKSHPGVKIEYMGEIGHDQYLEKLLVMAAAGTFPDVVHLYQPWVFNLAARDLTEPFPADITNRLRDRFYPITLQSLTTRGRLYALPTENQVMGLVYNKKLLREAGIGNLPQTWDELEALATKLTVKQGAKIVRQGLSMDFDSWATPAVLRTMLYANGGKFMDQSGMMSFTSAQGVKAVADLRKWFFETKMATADTSLLAQDKVAFGIGYPWHLINYEPKLKGKLQDVLGVASMPAGSAARTAYHYSWGYSIGKASKVKKEATDFVEFLTTRAGAPDDMTYIGAAMAGLGSLPSYKADAGKGRFGELSQWFGGFSKNLDWAVPTDGLALQEKMDSILFEELQPAVTAGKRSPAIALDNAKRRIDAVVKRGK